MKTLISCIAVVLCLQAGAQEVFQNLYGSSGIDVARTVIPLDNGEYVIAGMTGSYNGNQNGYFLRLHADGQLLSSNSVGGPNVDYFSSMTKITEGEFLCVGTSNSFGDDYDIFWALLDLEGEVSQEGTIDSGDWDFGVDIARGDDGSTYILADTYAGNTGRDIVLYKFDALMNEVWNLQMNNDGDDHAAKMLLNDGKIVVSGTHSNNDETDSWLFFVDENGALLDEWIGSDPGNQSIAGMTIASNGDYLLIGDDDSEVSGLGLTDMLVLRYDQLGNEVWHTYWGGAQMDHGKDIIELPGGNFIIGSQSNSFGNGIPDAYNLKTYRLSASGNYQSGQNLTIGANGDELITDLALCLDDGYIIVGQADNNALTEKYAYVVKVGADNEVETVIETIADPNDLFEQPAFVEMEVFPQPSSGKLCIVWPGGDEIISVVDMSGRRISRVTLKNGQNYLDLTGIDSGIYFLQSQADKESFKPKRIVIVR